MEMGKKLIHASLLALLIPLCASAFAEEPAADWIPGSYSPDWPHVVAAPQAGKWRPAPGYRFANDNPGDFTVVPAIPPEDVLLETAGNRTVHIPPPEGFLPISTFPAWQEMFGNIDAANKAADILGHWIDIDSTNTLWEANLCIPAGIPRDSCPLLVFRRLRKTISDPSLISGQALENAARTVESMNTASGTGSSLEVEGLRYRPIHFSEQRSFHVSHVRSQVETFEGQTFPSWTVGTTAFFWIRSRLFYLQICRTTLDGGEVETLLEKSRSMLRDWTTAFQDANGLTGDIADAEAALGLF